MAIFNSYEEQKKKAVLSEVKPAEVREEVIRPHTRETVSAILEEQDESDGSQSSVSDQSPSFLQAALFTGIGLIVVGILIAVAGNISQHIKPSFEGLLESNASQQSIDSLFSVMTLAPGLGVLMLVVITAITIFFISRRGEI